MTQQQPRTSPRPALLHRDRAIVCAPTQLWSSDDGVMRDHSAHGVAHAGWRWIRSIELRIDGQEVDHIATSEIDGEVVFRGVARHLDDTSGTAAVLVERMRSALPDGFVERATVVNGRDVPLAARLDLRIDIALEPLIGLRDGTAAATPVTLRQDGAAIVVDGGSRSMRLEAVGGELSVDDDGRVAVSRHGIVRAGDWSGVALEATFEDEARPHVAFLGDGDTLALPHTGRPCLDRWAARASADLADLMLDAGRGPFPAAGVPWELDLVARDALIAARLVLPLGVEQAVGPLRTLAALQGTRHDPATGEEPGMLPHRLRRAGEPGGAMRFGSVDATPLWIVLLHDAWRAGLGRAEVADLLPELEAAIDWLERRVEEGRGLLRLRPDADAEDTGPLAHEVRHALGPIAPVELQGLACLAAACGAALLEAFDRDGAGPRELASAIRQRFRQTFWVSGTGLDFPAAALDGRDEPVDVLTAAIGQLVGTTLLSLREERRVAALLLDERLSTGFGLRSLDVEADAYWPLKPGSGAVRPHDTALAIEGLLRRRMLAPARALAAQLERAAAGFDGRVPEWFAGLGIEETASPVPVPGIGGPRATSAAAVVPVHAALQARRAATRILDLAPSVLASMPELDRSSTRAGA